MVQSYQTTLSLLTSPVDKPSSRLRSLLLHLRRVPAVVQPAVAGRSLPHSAEECCPGHHITAEWARAVISGSLKLVQTRVIEVPATLLSTQRDGLWVPPGGSQQAAFSEWECVD